MFDPQGPGISMRSTPLIQINSVVFVYEMRASDTYREQPMTSQERQTLIAKYKEGYNEVTRSLEGFPADLLHRASHRRKMERGRDSSSSRRQRNDQRSQTAAPTG